LTKREIEIQALLLRHMANGCITAIVDWQDSSNEEQKPVALAALRARVHQLEAEAGGLDALVEQWEEFGPYFEVQETGK
jgi:hypothetical protein